MGKSRMRGTPPKVGVSNNQKSGGSSKVVGTDGQPFNKEPAKPAGAEPAIDPRLTCMGQFVIPQAHLYSHFDEIQEFMKDVVVTRAEMQMSPMGNVMVYTAISPKYFKGLGQGAMVPMYDVGRRLDGVFVVKPSAPMQGRPPQPPMNPGRR